MSEVGALNNFMYAKTTEKGVNGGGNRALKPFWVEKGIFNDFKIFLLN